MNKSINFKEEHTMETICICLPPKTVKIINKIVESGCVPSRSELIRTIILQYLANYNGLIKTFEMLTQDQIKQIGE